MLLPELVHPLPLMLVQRGLLEPARIGHLRRLLEYLLRDVEHEKVQVRCRSQSRPWNRHVIGADPAI
jgi:hypothetical protein